MPKIKHTVALRNALSSQRPARLNVLMLSSHTFLTRKQQSVREIFARQYVLM